MSVSKARPPCTRTPITAHASKHHTAQRTAPQPRTMRQLPAGASAISHPIAIGLAHDHAADALATLHFDARDEASQRWRARRQPHRPRAVGGGRIARDGVMGVERVKVSNQQIEQPGAGQKCIAAALRADALGRAVVDRLGDAGRRDRSENVHRPRDVPADAIGREFSAALRDQRRAHAGKVARLRERQRAVFHRHGAGIDASSVRRRG